MTQASPYHVVVPAKTKLLNIFRRILIFSGLDKKLSALTKNRSSSSFFVKLIPPNYLYKAGTVRDTTLNGITFKTDISDSMDHVVYFGIKDPAQNKLFELIKPGMTVMDVGTNIGLTAMTFAKLVGDNGKVFAFEPDPFNYNKASINVSLNKLPAISLHNIGLAEKDGTANLFNVNKTNRGMLRILREDARNKGLDRTSVVLTTLDHFLQQQNIRQVDLIKIDVEGYEFNVLKGTEGTLSVQKPILFIEVDDHNLKEQNTSPAALIDHIRSFGYRVTDAVTNEELNEHSKLDGCHIDIICKAGK